MPKKKQLLPNTNLPDHCKVEKNAFSSDFLSFTNKKSEESSHELKLWALSPFEHKHLTTFNPLENTFGYISGGVKKELKNVDLPVVLEQLQQLNINSPELEYMYLMNDWIGGYGFNRCTSTTWTVDIMISKRGYELDIFQVDLELKTVAALLIVSYFKGFFLGSCFIDHILNKEEKETVQRKINMLELKMGLEVKCGLCGTFISDVSSVVCQKCNSPLYDINIIKDVFL